MAYLLNFGWLNQKNLKRPQSSRRKTPNGCRLAFEPLEERRMLSAVFQTSSTVTTSNFGGPIIATPHVVLIFWGSNWGTTSTPVAGACINAVGDILSDGYTGDLKSYNAAFGNGSIQSTYFINDTSPGATTTNAAVTAMVLSKINSDNFPRPNTDPNLYYFVITQSGTSDPSENELGAHFVGTDSNGTRAHIGFTTNDGTIDTVSNVFSHELIEGMTDPEGNAWQVNPRGTNNWNEIADGAAQNYSARINGYKVQSYWVQSKQAYVVPFAEAIDFTSGLTLLGDQLANKNDVIAINVDGRGGMNVTLNGSTIGFLSVAITSIDGLTGNDTISLGASLSQGSSILSILGGSGVDTLNVTGTASADDMYFGDNNFFFTRFGVSFTLDSSVESLVVNGNGGNDSLTIGQVADIQGRRNLTYNGGSGTDSYLIENSPTTSRWDYTVTATSISSTNEDVPFSRTDTIAADVENARINAGSFNDTFDLNGFRAGATLTLNGAGGADIFNAGSLLFPFSGSVFGTISVVGALDADQLNVTDTAYSGLFNGYTVTGTSFSNSSNTLNQNNLVFDSTLEALTFYGSNAGSRNVSVVGIPAVTALHLIGGTGVGDTLAMDDRTLAAAPFRVDLGANDYQEYYGTPQSPSIRQLPPISGFENFNVTAHNSTNAINVLGLPGSQYTTINGGANADTITIYPHDAIGNLTINGGLSLFGGGGTDTLIVDDTAATSSITYNFTNTFAGFIDSIDGLGSGTVSPSGVENTIVKASSGDDTFDFQGHKLSTSVALYGNDGNDTLEVAPVSKNISANIVTLTNLTFDGGAGYDVMRLHNDNANASFGGYNVSGSQLQITEGLQTTYQATFTQNSVEYTGITAGTQSDFLSVPNSAAGTYYDFDGGGGAVVDELYLGSQLGPITSGIHGSVRFNGGGGGNDTITLYDQADVTGRTLHIGNGLVGSTPGDSIFGVGGHVQYVGVTGRMTIGLGTGADTVYAMPDASTPITINGGSPTVAPGDRLNLALSSAQSYVVSGAPASGNVTSSNRQTLNWTGFETGPIIDAIAPSIVAQSYDESGLVPTIFVQFSENVSNALTANFLDLINTTTAQQVSPSEIALTYDAGTNRASFTFPGFPNGVLPVGHYTAIIDGSLPDSFGNLLGVETPLSFTVAISAPQVPGDYNLNGEVDTSDYIVWRKTFGNAVSTFSGADGNGDGTIGPEDYDVWRANFGNTLPAAVAGNDATVAKGKTQTAAVQGSVISPDATTGNATPETPLIESILVARQSLTVFGSESKTVNVESAFASAYAGARKWSTFPAFPSDPVRLAVDRHGMRSTQAPNDVTDVHVAFEDQGQCYDNYQADEPSADLGWEAVDKVFGSRWGSVDLIAP